MGQVIYDVDIFKRILKENRLSARKLTSKDSPYYCGINLRTITRANQEGIMSTRTYRCISKIVDISECIVCQSEATYKELLLETQSYDTMIKNTINYSEHRKMYVITDSFYRTKVIGIYYRLKDAREASEKYVKNLADKYDTYYIFNWKTEQKGFYSIGNQKAVSTISIDIYLANILYES